MESRGLSELRTTPDCIPTLRREKNVALLTRRGIFTAEEIASRYEIMLENYTKTIQIEAATMDDIAGREILPAVSACAAATADAAAKKRALVPTLQCAYETKQVERLGALADGIAERLGALERAMLAVEETQEPENRAFTIRDILLPRMTELRAVCDEAETATGKAYWPFPTYDELLFSVR